jgi:branched-chain amino acid aminotransferase
LGSRQSFFQAVEFMADPAKPADSLAHHPFPVAFSNGRWLPQSETAVPIHDAGFVWGATVTDLCRTVRHQLYRWPDHFQRFRQSCRAARIYPAFAEDEIDQHARELVAHNARFLQPEQDLALVLLATPGPIGYYRGEPGGLAAGKTTFVMHTFPLPFERYRSYFQDGARLVMPSIRHVPPVCVDPKIKQRSRMHWWLAEQEVHQVDPSASALLLDLNGHVTETAGANFLLVRAGTVVSPPGESVLGGISLRVVRDLCRRLGIDFEERALTVYDCLNADEAMLTNTAFCLAGVSRINGLPIAWPGPVFQRLLEAWSEEIGLDIQGQIAGGP